MSKVKPIIIKICAFCRSEFSTKRNDACFCNWNCYQEFHRSIPVIKKCITCGIEFEPKRESHNAKLKINYCSWKCRGIRASKDFAEADYVPRFWAKVDKSGDCWVWTASVRDKRKKDSYGTFYIAGKRHSAHKIAYALANNSFDFQGLMVRHKCNNSLCVRPEHLILGTHQDNMDDRKKAGHYTVSEKTRKAISKASGGVNNKRALFTIEDVHNIRKLFAEGFTKTEICRMYNVFDVVICNLINGKTYKNVS